MALSCGCIFFQRHYRDETFLWTPGRSETMTAFEKGKELFPDDDRLRSIKVIVEATGDNLITRDAFSEMIEFEEILNSVTELSDTRLNSLGSIVRD